jgi:hypothetical protein
MKDRVQDQFVEDFYTEEEIETLLEDDEISASEEAFMRGYIDY